MAKSAKFKIAFTGTNCSGKTTTALDIAARMKKNHILAEVVTSQDRKVTWKDDHFPENFQAHYGMICGVIRAEVEASLKGDADVVFTDRSVLDLYGIALTDHPNCPQVLGMEEMILSWASTYTRIYRLKPLPYQEDGKRPQDDFRMRTYKSFCDFVEKHKARLPQVVDVERHLIYKDIKSVMGINNPSDIYEGDLKWQLIANTFNVKLMVKDGSPITGDIDVWVLQDEIFPTTERNRLANFAQAHFGNDITFDVMQAPEKSKQLESTRVFTPTVNRVSSV